MNREQAKDTAKKMIEGYLQQKGINTRKAFKCLNPAHDDKNPSMSLDRKNNRVKCFSCGESYDVFDLIAMDYGLTEGKDTFSKAYELFGIKVEGTPHRSTAAEDFSEGTGGAGQKQSTTGQNTHTHTHVYTHKEDEGKLSYYAECRRRIGETDYHRGLSAEVLSRHHIGFDPCFKTKSGSGEYVQWKALIIPTGPESFAARNTDPGAGHKDRYRKRGTAQIFSHKTLQTATKPIFVVEGEIDAMSIEEVGGAAVGLGSYDNVPLLLKLLEAKKPPVPLIVAFDDEESEDKKKRVEEAEKKLIEGLERLEIPFYRLHPYGIYHDANEALTKDREAFSEAIAGAENIERQAEEEERRNYLATNTGAYLQQFIDGIAASANTEAIPTGFNTLDKVLDGGFYEGLHTIGAISSLGKTSLILQMADTIAEIGRDVLIFSLEMARAELMSKSISRHTLRIALRPQNEGRYSMRDAKTARGITDGKRHIRYSAAERELIRAAIEEYGVYAPRIYIQEGIGNIGVIQIRETVEKHIRCTGRKPLVIVDYLQILAPYSERATDKQNTDKAVLELKRISRDCKVPVIAISSFNRQGYKEAVTMEIFKESGSIEYSSDTLIGLQLKGAGKKEFDPTAEKQKDPREIELVILKNRQGKVGDKICFKYYPMFNYFVEQGLSN